MATSSGELREMLIGCIEAVKAGDLGHNEARAICQLAQQVNQSLTVELTFRTNDTTISESGVGSLPLGESA